MIPQTPDIRHQRGALTVEMAIVAPILIFLLFGIIDMGLLFKDSLMLGSACREAVRVACVGCTTGEITERSKGAAVTLNKSAIAVQISYRETPAHSWVALGNGTDGMNSAQSGSQVKVTLSYRHAMIFGPLATMFGDNGTNSKTISATMIARRE